MKNRNIFLLSSSGSSELGAIAAGVIVQREAADNGPPGSVPANVL